MHCQISESYKSRTGTLYFPANPDQASPETGTRNGNETLQPQRKQLYIPTFTGRKYMEYARKILQIRQDWEKELKDLTENNEGELNVAFPTDEEYLYGSSDHDLFF